VLRGFSHTLNFSFHRSSRRLSDTLKRVGFAMRIVLGNGSLIPVRKANRTGSPPHPLTTVEHFSTDNRMHGVGIEDFFVGNGRDVLGEDDDIG
jgi:hypothetical protein